MYFAQTITLLTLTESFLLTDIEIYSASYCDLSIEFLNCKSNLNSNVCMYIHTL